MRAACAIALAFGLTLAAPAQDHVKKRLDNSPRHHEWVQVKHGDRTVHCFVVFPEVKEKATAVVVIHENKGLQDWVRGVADQVAEAGFIAIAPDHLSGHGPKGGRTSDFASPDAATQALYQLKTEQVMADLKAAADHVKKLPACNGKVAAAGFCWGGGQSFRFATEYPDLKAAFVFYGMFPHTKEDIAKINCPVYGFYGEKDARINKSVPASAKLMKDAGKVFEPVEYAGAGHGFMRAGEDPKGAADNRKAREDGWKRWVELLKKL
jgi:carboxymethylenebutenolidase